MERCFGLKEKLLLNTAVNRAGKFALLASFSAVLIIFCIVMKCQCTIATDLSLLAGYIHSAIAVILDGRATTMDQCAIRCGCVKCRNACTSGSDPFSKSSLRQTNKIKYTSTNLQNPSILQVFSCVVKSFLG